MAESPPTAGFSHEGSPSSCSTHCAICFEPLQTSTALPCACKVSYCMGCWDRSLAESFKARGEARCPTCRALVQVDFDAERGQLIFSRQLGESEDVTCTSERSRAQSRALRALSIREKMIEQVRPAVLRNLKQYGVESALACGNASSPIVVAPKCVCGSSFFKQTVLERARSFTLRSIPETNQLRQNFEMLDDLVRMNLAAGVVSFTCDICGKTLDIEGNVWTCANDDRTILHAATYDICEHCFKCATTASDADFAALVVPKAAPISYAPGDFIGM
eukprot:TRINITY_DN34330_c0_g1_i2.p1 TRINITY_DN34330_c0_g1~~TRINITY_DN34330_c0_g1_i2.p1  ORF type:complete len:276 (-),score=42.00 TRINITY_DN34330_c0_g1_i2:16-843(-)